MWLYIEVNAKDFMNECEPGVKNLNACCKAMLSKMLEGDNFIVEPKNRSKCAGTLTVRYYVDNLSPERRTYAQRWLIKIRYVKIRSCGSFYEGAKEDGKNKKFLCRS